MPSPLYPTTTISLQQAQGLNLLGSSSLLVIPITIVAGFGITFTMEQASPTQDYSLRSWVSLETDGNFFPTNKSFWFIPRIVSQLILVYDSNSNPPPGNYLNVPVPPGNYLLNILNLVNAENYFSFSSNVIQCS